VSVWPGVVSLLGRDTRSRMGSPSNCLRIHWEFQGTQGSSVPGAKRGRTSFFIPLGSRLTGRTLAVWQTGRSPDATETTYSVELTSNDSARPSSAVINEPASTVLYGLSQ
jgi:hypothetical protein